MLTSEVLRPAASAWTPTARSTTSSRRPAGCEDAAETDGDTGAASQQRGSVGDHPELGGWFDRAPTVYGHALSLGLAADDCHPEYPWHDRSMAASR